VKRIFPLALITLVVGFITMAFTVNPAGDPAGKQIFIKNKCTNCHSVESAGLVKGRNDLSNVGNALNSKQLANYLTKKEKYNDRLHMTSFKGDKKQLTVLSEWLASLKSEKK
jgi:cytochrome c2